MFFWMLGIAGECMPKRRKEVVDSDVQLEGYKVIERRRSNSAKDKDDDGIHMYLRNDNPVIANPEHAFVDKECLG